MLKIEETIKKDWKSYTPSEQKLATFFLNHLEEIPFETAASIGKRVSVSPMTVGRYIKKLGYADLRGIKAELRESTGDRSLVRGRGVAAAFDQASLKAKIKGVADVYRITESADWARIVPLIARAATVHVASFQIGRFLGLGFATYLQNLRPRVYFADGADGSYADILIDPDPKDCLILIDFARYSRHFKLLAEEAAARNVRMVILTDMDCHWARGLTDNVLMIETDIGIRTLSNAQLLFELLLASIADELKGAKLRQEAVQRLRQKFVGYVGAAENSQRPSKPEST
jgi:DNA-binding MurR/RpiR family transcriptional regulator